MHTPRYALLRGATRGERVLLMKGKAKLDSRLRGNDEIERAALKASARGADAATLA